MFRLFMLRLFRPLHNGNDLRLGLQQNCEGMKCTVRIFLLSIVFDMKTIIYTAIYLLLAYAVAYISVVYLGMAGMGKAIFLIIIGFALVGARAFTSAYSKGWGEKGWQWATIILRNLLGIPLWFTGFVFAWLEPSPFLFKSHIMLKLIGLFLMILGSIPFIWGHIELGW